MINAVFKCNNEKVILSARISGHANAVTSSTDPVCASASILALTLAQLVQFSYEEGKLRKKPDIQIADGRTSIVCEPKMDAFGELLHAYYCIEVGFHLLSRNCRDYVKLIPFSDSEKE